MKKISIFVMALLSLSFVSLTGCSSSDDLDIAPSYKPGGGSTDKEDDNDDDSGTVSPLTSKIAVYDYPDVIVESPKNLGYLKRSEFFEVEVSNDDESKEVYVMADRNQYKMHEPGKGNDMMTNHNHIANFSFDGEVEVTVKRLDGKSVADAVVYPKVKGYKYSVEGDALKITLTERAYIYVEFPDLKHKEPLFILGDPRETDVPKKNAANVELITPDMNAYEVKDKIHSTKKQIIYFSEGVYDFDPAVTDINYSGYQLPLLSDKKYYIPGGAVIVGSFYGTDCANSKIYGRGIVTACGKERLSSDTSIPYNLYMQSGGSGNVLDGIHFCAPNHFAVLSRDNLVARNCKMTGWWHQTDGWGAGANAILEDCFIKANDDNIKVYGDNQLVKNIVLYKQINGGGIQFAWGKSGAASYSTVDGLYVVNDDVKSSGDISNTAIFNLRFNDGSTINNNTIKNVYIENDYQRLIGIDNAGGKFINFTFENIQVTGKMHCAHNYLVLRSGEGTFDNILFKNLVINGEKITSDTQKEWNLKQGHSNSDKKITEYTHLVDVKYE